MNMQSTPPPKGHTISDLCDVSRAEMKRLQQQVQVLEDTVLTIFERGTPPTREERQSLQDFDLVMQTLAGMASFFEKVETQILDTGKADIQAATETVTLQKLRDRLREIGSFVAN